MALPFDEQTTNCLAEWNAFTDRLHEAARDAEPQTRYQILDMVGALRTRIASGLSHMDRLRFAKGTERDTLRRETQTCIAELQRITADKQSQWQWRFNSNGSRVLKKLMESVPVRMPTCGSQGSPPC